MYPERNPFSPQATMSLDGMVTYHVGKTPTARSRVPLHRLLSIQDRYLREPLTTGRAVALHGPHGTGKTHSVFVALSDAEAVKLAGKPPVVLYVRADGPDPLQLYRKLMSRWTATELAELAEHAFAGYAAEEFIASRDAVSGETEVTEQLRGDPQLALQAMQENELSYTAVVNRLEDEVRNIQGNYGNFERVLYGLANPALRGAAHRWLLADDVSPDELKRLGAAGVIEHLPEIRIGIHVLALLARRAGRPLTLAIDQVEAFVRVGDGTIDGANAGLLRGVVEDLVQEKGFVIASVGEDAWRRLPADLHQRFGPAEIQMPELSFTEAQDVLAAYLAPWPPGKGQPPAFPFRPDAVRELLLESGGNIRRFLQASFVVFENSPPGPGITRDIVRKALKTTGGAWAPGEKAVRRAVTDALHRVPGDIRVDHDVDGQRIDYAVTQGNRLILAVTISQALFGQDEAIKAVRQIEAIQALRRHQPTVVLVVVGYTSPDVREILQEVGRVVVANGPDFAVELDEALLGAVSGSEAFVPAVFEERLTELRDELVRLIAQRGTEERLVSTTLQRSYAERSAVEWNEEVRRFRVLWMTERQRIEEAIDDRRSKKRLDDAAELIAVHDEFIRLRRNRLRVLLGMAVLTFSALWATFLSLVEETDFTPGSLAGYVGPPLVLAALALFYDWLQHQNLPVGALQGIDDINRAVRQSSLPVIHSPDPFKRYRAILDRANIHQNPGASYAMALREPSGIIRRALLKDAIDTHPGLLLRAVQSNMEAVDLSAAAETDVMFENFWTDLPVKLRVITLLSRGSDKDDWRDFDRPKLETWLEWFVAAVLEHNISGSAEQMARAFVTDDDGLLAEALQDVSERDLRRAVATLSPLDDDGIGSYYWLDTSDLIRDMYIFFRKALFFLAGGVERSSTPSRA